MPLLLLLGHGGEGGGRLVVYTQGAAMGQRNWASGGAAMAAAGSSARARAAQALSHPLCAQGGHTMMMFI